MKQRVIASARFAAGFVLTLVFAPGLLAEPAVWERLATDTFIRGRKKSE